MTRKCCLLPGPYDDNLFEDVEEIEAVCNFEESDGLDCPPLDEDYFKCEANFDWMMDGKVFDGIDNDAPVDSTTTNKNKHKHGKGKPQSLLIVPELNKPTHGKGKKLKVLEVVYKHTEGKAENESCTGMKFEEVEATKMVVAADLEKSYEVKLESTKRKLQQDYEQCKKQRKVELIDPVDIPKPAEDPIKSRGKFVPRRICKPSSTVKQRLSQKLRVMGRKVC